MTQHAALEASDYRQLLFGGAGNSLLLQLSRLQELLDDYSDRILRKPWINLDTAQSRILMTLAIHTELRLTELQQQMELPHEMLLEPLGALVSRGLLSFSEAEEADPPLRLSATGAATIERMQRILRKADEVIAHELGELRPASLQASVAHFADRLRIGAN